MPLAERDRTCEQVHPESMSEAGRPVSALVEPASGPVAGIGGSTGVPVPGEADPASEP